MQSWPIIILTSLFTGMVISLEAAAQAVAYGFATFIGGTVASGEIRELGPMLTGIVFAGRAGAAVCLQQVDGGDRTDRALQSMGVSLPKYSSHRAFSACLSRCPC